MTTPNIEVTSQKKVFGDGNPDGVALNSLTSPDLRSNPMQAMNQGQVTQGVTSFKANMKLHDDRLLDIVSEPWWSVEDPSHPGQTITPSVTMITLFPSLIIQQQVNSLSTRQIIPNGQGTFDFVWTHFGFQDDTPEMTQRRLRQSNLYRPVACYFERCAFWHNKSRHLYVVVPYLHQSAEAVCWC